MTKNIKGLKDKLIDVFLITRVKVGSFIKEHKMTSAFIGLFLFSCVIALIVYANEDPYGNHFKIDKLQLTAKDITSSDQLSYDETNKNYKVQSFSTLSYNINYLLDLKKNEPLDGNITRTTVIEAIITCEKAEVCSQLSWNLGDESVISTIDNNDSNVRKITFEKSDVGINTTTTQIIYLNVGNLPTNSKYKVSINAYEKTNEEDSGNSRIEEIGYVVESKEATVSANLVGGTPYKIDETTKYVPFGIMLETENINNNGLKGLYINPEQSFNLVAKQDGTLIDLITSNEGDTEYFGTYTSEKSFLKNMTIVPNNSEVTLIAPEETAIEKQFILKIKNINFDNILETENKLIFGSYFVTAKSIRSSENKRPINVTLTEGETNSETVSNEYNSKGEKTIALDLYKNDSDGINSKIVNGDYIAYGEEIILNSKFNYSSDADSDLSELVITIPMSGLSLINYDSDSGAIYDLKAYDKNNKLLKDLNGTLKLCKGTTCNVPSSDSNYDNITSVEYYVYNVKPGTTINFNIKSRVQSYGNSNNGTEMQLKSIINYKETTSSSSIEEFSDTLDFNLTPFKVSSKVLINGSNNDVMVNSSDTSITQISIYPNISIPIQSISTTAAKIGNFTNYELIIKLPKYVNLIENSEYIKYTSYENGTLIYNLKNISANDWIEPVMFDISYNVQTPNNTPLTIEVVSQATATSTEDSIATLKDESSLEKRTTTRTITYINNEDIAYNQYSTLSSISKNGTFEIVTELNNTTSSTNNLKLLTILPYNDAATNSFTGTYTISSIPANTKCTKDKNISKDYLLSSAPNWENCSTSISSSSGVTAILTEGISLTGYYNQKFKVTTSNNSTDNIYKFDSYFANSNDKIVSIPSTKVNVMSKKITGTVWQDFDTDGIMDSDESRVSDVSLSLYNSKNELVTETTPNEKGLYTFGDVSVGKYYIVANFDNTKYGFTNSKVISDLSITSSFISINSETEEDKKAVIRTEEIEITEDTKSINNINLGLTLKPVYKIKLSKYITSVEVSNGIGIVTKNDFNNVTLAKVNIKNMTGFSMKVLYNIEIENIGFYPGFVLRVKDYIPAGMSFNPEYKENEGWELTSDGILENTSLKNELIYGGEKKYLPLALDISRKEAGSFINTAEIEDDDLQILKVTNAEEGDINE